MAQIDWDLIVQRIREVICTPFLGAGASPPERFWAEAEQAASDHRLPTLCLSLFETHSILFIGYGLRGWNIRVLLRAIRHGRMLLPDLASFAVQRCPDDPSLVDEWNSAVLYWSRFEFLDCFDIDALEFAQELKRRYDEVLAPK